MKFNQTGVALIVGGSSGMGLETAKLLSFYFLNKRSG